MVGRISYRFMGVDLVAKKLKQQTFLAFQLFISGGDVGGDDRLYARTSFGRCNLTGQPHGTRLRTLQLVIYHSSAGHSVLAEGAVQQ